MPFPTFITVPGVGEIPLELALEHGLAGPQPAAAPIKPAYPPIEWLQQLSPETVPAIVPPDAGMGLAREPEPTEVDAVSGAGPIQPLGLPERLPETPPPEPYAQPDLLEQTEAAEVRASEIMSGAKEQYAREAMEGADRWENDLVKAKQGWERDKADANKERDALLKQEPDSRRFWNNLSGLQQIGLVVTAALHGYLDPRGENRVLSSMERAIERDMANQRSTLERRMELLKGKMSDVNQKYEADRQLATQIYLGQAARLQGILDSAAAEVEGMAAPGIHLKYKQFRQDAAALQQKYLDERDEKLRRLRMDEVKTAADVRKTLAETSKLRAETGKIRSEAASAGTKADPLSVVDPTTQQVIAQGRNPTEAIEKSEMLAAATDVNQGVEYILEKFKGGQLPGAEERELVKSAAASIALAAQGSIKGVPSDKDMEKVTAQIVEDPGRIFTLMSNETVRKKFQAYAARTIESANNRLRATPGFQGRWAPRNLRPEGTKGAEEEFSREGIEGGKTEVLIETAPGSGQFAPAGPRIPSAKELGSLGISKSEVASKQKRLQRATDLYGRVTRSPKEQAEFQQLSSEFTPEEILSGQVNLKGQVVTDDLFPTQTKRKK